MRVVQLICLVLGVFLLSLGAGMLGGRLADEKHARDTARPPEPAESAGTAGVQDASSPPSITDGVGVSSRVAPPAAIVADNDDRPAKLPEPLAPPTRVSPRKPDAAKENTLPAPRKAPDEFRPKHVIQVMSTSSRNDAEATRRRIVARGFPSMIRKVDIPGKGKWFRVYVGPYETEAEAMRAMQAIRNIPEYSESFLKVID